MALPITVPYTFGNATTAIPLSNLDSDYATVYQAVNGIGNGSVALANVAITGGTISGNTTASNVTVSSGTFTNVTLSNVTISSVSTPITAAEGGTGSSSAFTTNGVVYASSTSALSTGSALTFDGTNLGIGTTSPAAKLDVIANSTYQLHLATTTGNYSSAGIYLGALGTSDPGYYGYVTYDQTTETLRLGNRSGSGIGGVVFYTNILTPTEKARIDSSGNLLVGTTSASGIITTSANVNSQAGAIYTRNTNASSGSYSGLTVGNDVSINKAGFILASSGQSSSGFFAANSVYAYASAGQFAILTEAAYPLIFGTNSTERARIDSNGYLLVGYTSSNGAYKLQVNSQIFATSAIIATSDARYKTNVTPISNGLSLVNKLNPVSFDWKEHSVHNFDTKNTNVGFLAQDVQEVLKNEIYLNSVIRKNETELPDGTKEEFLGLSDSSLIPILVKAIQEQQALITQLTTRLTALENK